MTSSTHGSTESTRYSPESHGRAGPGGHGRQRPPPPRDLQKLFDRLPPHSSEAEMSLLGAMILDPKVTGDVIGQVPSSDYFYSEAHASIFDALVRTYDTHRSGDLVQLSESLKDTDALENVGGAEYLVQLAESVPSSASAPHYARIVREKAQLRRLIEAAGQILYDAYHTGVADDGAAREVLDRAEQSIFKIADQAVGMDSDTLEHLLQETLDILDANFKHGRTITGIATGFYDLDHMTNGLQQGEMIIVAARPSMGKCLAHDSEIVMEDGSIATIEEVVQRRNGSIPTLGGDFKLMRATPSAFVDDGKKPVYEVVTRLGRRVVTTLTHPFLTINGWLPLSEVNVGDRVAVPRRLEVFGGGEARECEVKLLAYLIGDGGLTGRNPRFTASNPRVAQEFADAVTEFGGLTLRKSSAREREAPSWRVSAAREEVREARARFAARLSEAIKERGVTGSAVAEAVGVSPATITHWRQAETSPAPEHALSLCEFLQVETDWLCPDGVDSMRSNQSNPLTRWLLEMGLMGHGAHDKHVPKMVFTLRRELVALFLNRLFATDGWATTLASGQAQLGYSTVNERLARQVQHLLLRFGVIASLRQRWVKYRDARRPAWQLDITDARSIRTFAEQIGIYSKEERSERAVAAVGRRRYQTNRDLIPAGVWSRIDAARGDLSWRQLARRIGATGDNLHVGTRALSRARLGKIAEALDDQALRDLAGSDVYWDEIVSIEPAGVTQVYDLTVPTTHNFVANDVCVHNTAFALNLAEQIAFGGSPSSEEGPHTPVGIFSMEMSRQAVAQRLLCAHSGVDSHKMRKNLLSHDDFRLLAESCGKLSQARMFIDDTPGLTALLLRAKARRMVAQHGVKCIFIDYMQLMSAPSAARESRQAEVSAISRGIKALARELHVPVVCLSQLNRGAEQREGHRPRMADLRESGSIEQDADVIMLLHREEYYHQHDPDWEEENPEKAGLAEIIIAKQRNGPTGNVELKWNAPITRFQSLARRSGGYREPKAASATAAVAPGDEGRWDEADDLPI